MKRSLMFCILCATWGLFQFSSAATAQPHTVSHGFPNGFSNGARCHHVIQQILRHGVNNRFDRCQASALLNSGHLTQPPFGGVASPDVQIGDLQLAQIHQLPPEGPVAGPKFSVTLVNQSARSLSRFHVSAVAVFGNIHPDSPCTTISIDSMNAGESRTVTIQLPINALSMGNRNGEALGYQTLVMAIDSFDELLESDEANNIRAVSAAEIPMLAPVLDSAIKVPESAAIVPAQPSVLASPKNAAEVSVDALDVEHPTPDSLRSAIEQLRTPPEQTAITAVGP